MKELKNTSEFSTEDKIKEISKSFPQVMREMKEHHQDLSFFSTANNISSLAETDYASRFSDLNEVEKFYNGLKKLDEDSTNKEIIEKRIAEILALANHSYENTGLFEKEAKDYLNSLDMTKINSFNAAVDNLHEIIKQQIDSKSKKESQKMAELFEAKRQEINRTMPIKHDEKIKSELEDLDRFEESIINDNNSSRKSHWIVMAFIIIFAIIGGFGILAFLMV